MKKTMRLLALFLVAVMIGTGCGPKVSEQADADKTQLNVGTYPGGIGRKWLEEAIERFEEKYADTSFEEGKKGVQVIISEYDYSTGGNTLKEKIEFNKTEVYFTESVFYYEWVNEDKLYDITDAATEKLTEFGEEESIVDKMDEDLVKALTMDGKIYAVPFWMASYGITYNATLFDQYGWYYAADGSFTNASGKLGAGPDGKAGTYDDGLPATYDDFFKLMDKINGDNVVPLQWVGGSDYLPWFFGSLFADYAGSEELMLNYTFDGTATLVKTDTINPETGAYETEEVQITPQNGYELARQEGLLAVSKFAEKLLRGNGTYYEANKAISGSYKVQDAQLAFIRNPVKQNDRPVAMIIEGSWWENEASVSFEATYGTGKTKFDSIYDYKYMPFPKANEDKIGSENMWVSPLESYCFVNPNVSETKAELAKKFIQFCHTDESMTKFTSLTGILKPYDYEIDDTNLTAYTKSIVEATENSTVVFPKSDNPLYRYSPGAFWLSSLVNSRVKVGESISAENTFLLKKGGEYVYNYVDYFKGITNRRAEIWKTFSSVLN